MAGPDHGHTLPAGTARLWEVLLAWLGQRRYLDQGRGRDLFTRAKDAPAGQSA